MRSTISTPSLKTLAGAREWLHNRLDDGVECPCCDQYAKLYKRKLNSGMARSLFWLVNSQNDPDQWIDVPSTAPRHVMRSREFGKLAHWGLTESKSSEATERKCSGIWRPTKRGIQFVKREIVVPSYAFIYNNQVVRFSSESLTIMEALGEHFKYDELMG